MAASPLTEMALSLSSVGMGELVVMTATGAVAVLPSTEMALSLSSVGIGVLVVMTATGAGEVLSSIEMALSLSSVGMGVLVVMTAAGSENPRDPAAMAVSPPAGMALSLSSVGDGRAGGDDSYWGWGSIIIDRDGVVAVVSGDGRCLLYTSPSPRDGV